MDFETPVSFKYADYTGSFDKVLSIHWDVTFSNQKELTVVTTVSKGVYDLDYIKYLINKGACFIDDKEESIKGIGHPKELIALLKV